MKHFLNLIFITYISLSISCEYFSKKETNSNDLHKEAFQLDTSFYTYESESKIYSSYANVPIFNSNLITLTPKFKLNLGESVRIIAANETYEKDVDSCWYIVEYYLGGSKDTGYVQAKNFSNILYQNLNSIYIIQKERLTNSKDLMKFYLVEFSQGKELNRYLIDTFPMYEVIEIVSKKVNILNGKIKEVFFVSNFVEECGKQSSETVFFKLNDKLYRVFKNFGISDADIFYNSTDLYYCQSKQFFPFNRYEESQALDSVPTEISPYLDSPQYLMSYAIEEEAEYVNEKDEIPKTNADGETIMKTNYRIYQIHTWSESKGLKLIKKFDISNKSN